MSKHISLNEEFKNKLIKLAEEMDLDYKIVSWDDGSDFVVYPDEYTNNGVYFTAYRFYDRNDECEKLFEDENGNDYSAISKREFFDFVKHYFVNFED